MVNRQIGAISVAVAALSSLARVYCGLHYVTDIVGGALLAVVVVCVFLAGVAPFEKRLLAFARRRPALVATVVFLFAAQVGTLFYDLREIAGLAARHVKEAAAASNGEG